MGFLIAAALIGGAIAVDGTLKANSARKDAAESQKKAVEEGKKVQAEGKANNAAQAAAERRSQIREERVRRARIMQSSENTGVDSSSGEAGALGSLATGLGTNIGSNLGRIASANRVSDYNQNIATFQGDAQQSLFKAQKYDSMSALGSSIFSAAGGFGTLGSIGGGTGVSSDPFKSDARPRGGS